MTTDQIKAELRRSACEDVLPSFALLERSQVAWDEQMDWRGEGNHWFGWDIDAIRTFFLLVAEALE